MGEALEHLDHARRPAQRSVRVSKLGAQGLKLNQRLENRLCPQEEG